MTVQILVKPCVVQKYRDTSYPLAGGFLNREIYTFMIRSIVSSQVKIMAYMLKERRPGFIEY
jgi:hypothetical protein